MHFPTCLQTLLAAAVISMAATLSTYAGGPDSGSKPLTESERSVFRAELQQLQDQLAGLSKSRNLTTDRWADAEIFIKGVVWALDFGPVSDDRNRGLVAFGLRRARERIEALAAGKQPWLERRGRCARGFISAVDGSVQP